LSIDIFGSGKVGKNQRRCRRKIAEPTADPVDGYTLHNRPIQKAPGAGWRYENVYI
jgi:hypothetical protein